MIPFPKYTIIVCSISIIPFGFGRPMSLNCLGSIEGADIIHKYPYPPVTVNRNFFTGNLLLFSHSQSISSTKITIMANQICSDQAPAAKVSGSNSAVSRTLSAIRPFLIIKLLQRTSHAKVAPQK